MEFAIALGAFAFNAISWLVLLGIQTWESRTGRIPARLPGFKYMQDWRCLTWGDLVGLGIMDAAVTVELTQQKVPAGVLLGLALCGVIVTWLIRKFLWATRAHIPDSGYLAGGKETVMGHVHLMYYASQITLALLGLRFLFTGINPHLALGFAGSMVWVLAMSLDTKEYQKQKGAPS